MDLSVIDVSALVHTAEHVDIYRERSYYGYPVGGIHFLMRQICTKVLLANDFVLCFDSPTFRKGLLSKYKSGREHSPAVISQLESLYEGLSSCGIRCEKFDGYEADDVVDWAVQQNLKDYSEILIVGNDYDLCHSVQSKVRFTTINRGMNNIFRGNFEHSIEKGRHVLFNTISAYKVMCGCHSDKIPAMKLANGMGGYRLYCAFVDWAKGSGIPLTYANTTDPRFLMLFAKNSGLFDDGDVEELLNRIKLVYPAACPDGVKIVPNSYYGLDKDKLCQFLTIYNDYDSIKCLGGKKAFLSEEAKQMLRDKGRSLTTGEFAADKNIEQRAGVSDTLMRLDAFSKEFV